MASAGDLRVSAILSCYSMHSIRPSPSASKVSFAGFLNGACSVSEVATKLPRTEAENHTTRCQSCRSFGITGDNKFTPETLNQETEGFLLNAVKMSFFERLNIAWKILFPTTTKRKSNANIAKKRLKMILFSDRCAVSDEAKQKIISNIVGALSDFVVIDSEDKVQLSVSTDPDIGTVYSVIVPVKRVRAAYLDEDDLGMITNVDYKDTGESPASVDVRFDFFNPQ